MSWPGLSRRSVPRALPRHLTFFQLYRPGRSTDMLLDIERLDSAAPPTRSYCLTLSPFRLWMPPSNEPQLLWEYEVLLRYVAYDALAELGALTGVWIGNYRRRWGAFREAGKQSVNIR